MRTEKKTRSVIVSKFIFYLDLHLQFISSPRPSCVRICSGHLDPLMKGGYSVSCDILRPSLCRYVQIATGRSHAAKFTYVTAHTDLPLCDAILRIFAYQNRHNWLQQNLIPNIADVTTTGSKEATLRANVHLTDTKTEFLPHSKHKAPPTLYWQMDAVYCQNYERTAGRRRRVCLCQSMWYRYSSVSMFGISHFRYHPL
jgi:hypothetical protein